MTLSEVRARVDELLERLTAEGYGGHEQRARSLVGQCRATLSRATGEPGPWEEGLLELAERAVAAGFLRLGLVTALNALAVSHLSAEEYDYGICQSRPAQSPAGVPHHANAHAAGENGGRATLPASVPAKTCR